MDRVGAAALGAVLVAGLTMLGCDAPSVVTPPIAEMAGDARFVSGRVVDTDGHPIAGAAVTMDGRVVTSDEDGRFAYESQRPAWVSVDVDGYIGRTRSAAPAEPVLIRLTPAADETVSIHFAGDVMAGRRFYDRNEDGDTADGLLPPVPTLEDHLALLSDIAPLLSDADLSVVNLETPLTQDPWYDVSGERPDTFHPTKDFAFSSDPLLAEALAESGVDVVDLGNNHLFDRLGNGVTDTIQALDAAGVVHFGAGGNDAEAWRPALVTIKGQRIAFIGCTTILGEEHALSYVATADKAGAAACDRERLRQEVEAAVAGADAVVVMVHGGYEYDPVPSDNVAALTAIARDAGARLVVNHHPHVVGGLDWDSDSLAAHNMGNFLFDQTIWQTFPSYILNVGLRAGRVVRAYLEPTVIDDYTPRGLVGKGADRVTRIAAGLNPGPFVVEDGAVEVDVAGRAVEAATVRNVLVGDERLIVPVPSGQRLVSVADPQARLGRDLLFFGDFEDDDIDEESPMDDAADFWEAQAGREFGPGFGSGGSPGARITRSPGDLSDAFLNPKHRILLSGGTSVSAIGLVHAPVGAAVAMQLSWYPDTEGQSTSQTIEPVSLGERRDDGWVEFRLDAVAPPGTVAVGYFLLLRPPEGDDSVEARFDDLALIQWDDPAVAPSVSHQFVDLTTSARLEFVVEHLPGGEEWAQRALVR